MKAKELEKFIEYSLKTIKFEQESKKKEYEDMFFEKIILNEEGNCDFSNNRFIQESDNAFVLERVENHKRIYKKIK